MSSKVIHLQVVPIAAYAAFSGVNPEELYVPPVQGVSAVIEPPKVVGTAKGPTPDTVAEKAVEAGFTPVENVVLSRVKKLPFT